MRFIRTALVALLLIGSAHAAGYPNEFYGTVTATLDDATNNAVSGVIFGYHTTSGTPSSGIGSKLVLGAENSAGSSATAAEMQGYLSTVTSGSEQGAFLLRLMNAGTLQNALIITAGTNSASVGSGQTSVSLWNTTTTSVSAFGAATSVSMGAGASSTGTLSFTTKLNLNSGNIDSNQASTTLLATPTTVTAFGAATTLSMSGASGGSNRTLVFGPSSGNGHSFLVFNTGANGYIGSFDFAEAGSVKWGLRHTHGTDTWYVHSYTNNAAELTCATTGVTIRQALAVNGNTTLGDASTDTVTVNGRLLPRSVTDAGPMTATAGTAPEIVYNTSNGKWYGCTATGSPATWSALN